MLIKFFTYVSISNRRKVGVFQMKNDDIIDKNSEVNGAKYRLECLRKEKEYRQKIKDSESLIRQFEQTSLDMPLIIGLKDSIRTNTVLADREFNKYYLSLFEDCKHVWVKDINVHEGVNKYICIKCKLQLVTNDFEIKGSVSKLRYISDVFFNNKGIKNGEERMNYIKSNGIFTDIKCNSSVVLELVDKILYDDPIISDENLIKAINKRYQYLPKPKSYDRKFRF